MTKTTILYYEGRLPTLNEYINSVNRSRWAGAGLKRKYTNRLARVFKKEARGDAFHGHVTVFITFFEGTARRDDDGVMHGMKYILDALRLAGIIENDSPKYCHVMPSVFKSRRQDKKGKPQDYIQIVIIESKRIR